MNRKNKYRRGYGKEIVHDAQSKSGKLDLIMMKKGRWFDRMTLTSRKRESSKLIGRKNI